MKAVARKLNALSIRIFDLVAVRLSLFEAVVYPIVILGVGVGVGIYVGRF